MLANIICSRFFCVEVVEESADYIPLNLPKEKEKKSRNPLDTGDRNPFVYDSSDSEDEGQDKQKEIQVPEEKQVKAVWRENLFFSKDDSRLRGNVFNVYYYKINK